MKNLNVVILAAGQGKRMFSNLPKVLHTIGNKPMLQHVIETALKLNPTKLIIVYGHGGEKVKQVINEAMPNNKITWCLQDQQLGTGHALKCAMNALDNDGSTLLLYGDVPLINVNYLSDMLDKHSDNIVMLTTRLDNPSGYGRILRNDNSEIIGIVEEKDASQGEKYINEINTGFYVFPNNYLPAWLNQLSNNNNQKEYYVTDLIAMAKKDQVEIDNVNATNHGHCLGINNKLELEKLERLYQLDLANELLLSGATLLDKSRIDIRGKVIVGMDCVIDINCTFEGNVVLGNGVSIGVGCILKNVEICDGVAIKPYSIIEGAVVGANSLVGPFARLRPGAKLSESSHVGNFVEIKNSTIGVASKVNHLTYIGDAEIGAKVNVGAGSVTCNYDGKNKFKTVIEDNVFIGSGTMMVAPVTIASGGVIGAGSTITKNTEKDELTVARSKQQTIHGWLQRRNRKN